MLHRNIEARRMDTLLIDQFVAKLWQHARLRALGSGKEILEPSAKQLNNMLLEVDAVANALEIGEALTAHIINYVVQEYGRKSCTTCRNIAECENVEHGPCKNHNKEAEASAAARVLLYDAIFYLDGAYGFNAGEVVQVVAVFLDEIQKPHD